MVTETARVEVSRHKCLIYDGHPSEQLPIIVPLLIDGLKENRRCLYLGNPEMVSMVDSALTEKGVDTDRETRRGALRLSSDRSHLKEGRFDPQAMVAMLRKLIDDAVREGFQGLCATGDMMWELGTEKNFERLLEYEALLENVFLEKPLQGICQYHRDTIPAQAVRDALLTHQSAYIGNVLNQDNLFYVPPELLLDRGGSARDRQGEWMCQQIIRILNAERKRDQALAALSDSEAKQRRLAEQLAEANRGLEHRIEERTAQLEAANKDLEAFSYSVSHDLRAPLRHIDGFSQILLDDYREKLDNGGQDTLQNICHATKRMNELIEGMLQMSRLSRKEMKREKMDLAILAREVERDLRSLQPNRQVEIAIADSICCTGDRTLMRAVLENLIGNAWKFTSKRAQARIEIGKAGEEDGDSIFFVLDNGSGFDMEYAQRLFGVFQRLHSEEEFPGTGVGLATVHRIIRKHGGRIWAKGSQNKGATFFFTLPEDSAQTI
jgi:signal transduction histidine kinase